MILSELYDLARAMDYPEFEVKVNELTQRNMITFDIEIFGKAQPFTLHNDEVLKLYLQNKGKLIEFIGMALDELSKEESEIIKIKLKELWKNLEKS